MKLFRRKGSVPVETPEEREARRRARGFRVVLSVLSGAMLGCSFPPLPLGVLACFGLIPLLIVLSETDRIGPSLRYGYLAMLVFHAITLNWTGDYVEARDPYMMIAGGLTMVAHPLFYFIPLSLYVLVRRRLGEGFALAALPFLWVGYEYSHALSEWSFPWLTIGNSQTYDLARIQMVSVTGVYGLSFWILVLNVIGYQLYRTLRAAPSLRPSVRNVSWLAALLLVFELPRVYGAWVLSGADTVPSDSSRAVTVGMIQANVDPWLKWEGGAATLGLYERLTTRLVDSAGKKPDLILWPETAVPYDVLYESNQGLRRSLEAVVASIGTPVLTGMPHFVVYPDSAQAPPSARRMFTTGERYDAFNAAALFQPGTEEVPWYGKMKMVPLAERVPYADLFSSLDFLRWGVGIGGWQIGPDTTIFVLRGNGARFSTMICYESVYPGFVAAFVRKGAEFITLITIDSWWDHMSGAYQHQQFAVLRAVENRRWIARCAVGGISCYIDPFGRVFDRTELFTQRLLSGTVWRRDDVTFYTAHIDLVGKMSLAVAALFVLAALGSNLGKRKQSS